MCDCIWSWQAVRRNETKYETNKFSLWLIRDPKPAITTHFSLARPARHWRLRVRLCVLLCMYVCNWLLVLCECKTQQSTTMNTFSRAWMSITISLAVVIRLYSLRLLENDFCYGPASQPTVDNDRLRGNSEYLAMIRCLSIAFRAVLYGVKGNRNSIDMFVVQCGTLFSANSLDSTTCSFFGNAAIDDGWCWW